MNATPAPAIEATSPSSPVASRKRALARLCFAWLLWPVLAIAAIVTAADVANAILNSPTANAFMKAHANEIGALAIKVESGGDTTAYNGSCCYGVLQLNTSNIVAAGYSVLQYRYATLQEQINGWAQIESQALNDPVIQQLAAMSTFDGHPVDAAMLIACVQLGQGNCRTMIKSGHCDGFHDSNGTTICSMAAKMDAAMAGTGGTTGPSAGGGYTGGGSYAPPAGTAPDEAFTQGAGLPMGNVSQAIKLVAAALVLTWLAWSAAGSWSGFTKGRVALPDMTQNLSRAIVVVLMVIWLVN